MNTNANLGDLVSIRGGGTPDRKNLDYWNGSVPWASVKDITDFRLTKTEEFITQDGVKNSATSIIPEETVVVVTRMAVGRACITNFPVAINQDLKALFCSPKLIPKYLLWFLISASKKLNNRASGATVKGIKIDALKDLKIPLPPLEEQKRIAAILDKADAIRRKRKEAIALTEELLRSTFLDMFGDPVTNPKGWDKVKLDTVVTKIDSGWSPKCDSREADFDEWGVLKLGAVTLGHFNSLENKALLPETEPRPELEVKEGDLLFSRKNTYELVGATAYVHRTRERLLLPDLIFRLCLSEKVDPVYLWQALSRKTMRNELSRLASGSSGSMPNISKARLKNLLVPIPPIDLQLKYKEAVNRFSRCQESQQQTALHTNNLFNSLLQKAFRGEL